jgi:branched-chain amino acid transport system permease protein
VVVTLGIRSISAAAIAGISFALFPAVLQTYLPARWGEVPALFFGLGAIMVARHPEGALVRSARQLRALVASRRSGATRSAGPVDERWRDAPAGMGTGGPAGAAP